MKIKQLHFKAHGLFTDLTLDFSSQLPGLHVVYGPNEAGKSTALRGLLALLFGYGHVTNDAFIHPYNQLSMGGQLADSKGKEIFFYRRKRSKNDLFDQQKKQLAPEVLYPYLRGLDEETFMRMYAIDHGRLVQGGQGILEQQGEVGQALFSAGAGFASIRTILSALEQEAGALFRPRASKPEINQSLARYQQLRDDLRGVILKSDVWQKHQQNLKQAEKSHEAKVKKAQEYIQEIRELEQLQKALPFLGQRHDVQQKLQALGQVQALPEDFAQRRAQWEESLTLSQVKLKGLLARHKVCLDRVTQVQPDEIILEQAARIEDVQERLGAYRKAQEDRPRLEGQRISAKTEAAHLLDLVRPELSLDQVEILRPILLQRKAVQDLEQDHALAEQAVAQAQSQKLRATQEVQALAQDLTSLLPGDDLHALAQAVTWAHKAGDLDLVVQDLKTRLAQLEKELSTGLQSLGLWEGDMEALLTLALPWEESITIFATKLGQIEEQFKDLVQEKKRLSHEEKSLCSEILVLEQGPNIPDVQELQDLRQHRDHGWSLVRRAWLHGEDVIQESQDFDAHQPLDQAYETSVLAADALADSIYQEAERVQKNASLAMHLESVRLDLEANAQALASLEQHQDEILRQWQALWQPNGIKPLSPVEMQGWLTKFKVQRAVAEKIVLLQEEVRVQEKQRQEIIKVLQAAMTNADQEPLSLYLVVHQAEQRLEEQRQEQGQRTTLMEVLREKERFKTQCQLQVEEARQNLKKITQDWEKIMLELGLPAATKPGVASEYIDALQKMFVILEQVRVLGVRQQGIDRDALEFETRVQAVARDLNLQSQNQDPASLVLDLRSRLQQALAQQTRQEQQNEEIALLDQEISTLKAKQKAEEQGLAQFLAQIGVASLAESIVVEEKWRRFQELRSRADDLDSALASIAPDQEIKDLEALALTWSTQDLDGYLGSLKDALAQLEPEIHDLSQQIGQEKNELQRMDGAGVAARINEELEAEEAKISRLSQDYLQTIIASAVLRQAIENFRQAHQNPLLEQASKFFQTLTLGSFSGLRADLDAADRPVLWGVRSEDQWVPVIGMSSGTRDQLYLALRLAALVWQADLVGPMPFIVDDVLINFDEQRIGAALQVFADLAAQFQIVLFTHQAVVRDLAAQLNRADRVFLHYL